MVKEERVPGVFVPTGAPLRHYGSGPPVPLESETRTSDQPAPLIRTMSMSTGSVGRFLTPS
jgi:hypothetical protein